MPSEIEDLLEKIAGGEGTLAGNKRWLERLKELCSWFDYSDQMYQMQLAVESRRIREQMNSEYGTAATRELLIELTEKILQATGTAAELDAYLSYISDHVPHPEVSDLIYYPDADYSAEQIVDIAMAYKPRVV